MSTTKYFFSFIYHIYNIYILSHLDSSKNSEIQETQIDNQIALNF